MEIPQASRYTGPVDVAIQLGASLWAVPGSCSHEAWHPWTGSRAANIIAEHVPYPQVYSQPRATWPEMQPGAFQPFHLAYNFSANAS